MAQLSKQIPETLWEDRDFILSRSTLAGDPVPILVLAPAAERPAPEIIARLEQAYALREELAGCSVAKPLALTLRNGVPVLVMQDPGGELLAGLIGQPWDIAQFLPVAIAVSSALGGIHARDLIHRDIKPANILVNLSADQAWLIGCCFVSRQPREQVLAPPSEITGSLAYMSPEQTGRMNRSIDARSDLYSLGITFYEMLTGVLPFEAAEPMEWVHCHIARPPPLLTDRVRGIPESVSAIVSKLLAKTAEDRYQTAAGVEADLRNCLTEWELHARITPFPLGARDILDRLLIPEKLYGRDKECESLVSAFNRVVTTGMPELVLVSGYSGVGKSSAVNELHKATTPQRGTFISGKFDQQSRNIPYATLAQAFQGLVRQILSKSEAEVVRYRDAVRQAVGKNGQLLANLVPDLEMVIGKQPPVPEIPAGDAHNRFRLTLRRFMGAFARPEEPLALFLDDLQWLDAATLGLLEDLLTDPELRNCLIIGAYRDNEITSSHPLMHSLDEIRKTGAKVSEIALGPLSVEDL
ncbi:MAG: AAA family ATPase, partial [Verrucomicrobia bacterium]|nr:AAA family ATPase [Verrucomicrobiota bacterium]